MDETHLKDELLEQVYSNPGDLDQRAVFADFLASINDPRGEFIALQLRDQPTKQQARRVRELLKLHARDWLGDLAPVLSRKRLVFRHGFPTVGRLNPGCWNELIALSSNRGWTTFAELDLSETNGRQVNEAFFRSESVRVQLTALRNVGVANLGVIGRASGEWALRRISTRHSHWAAVREDVWGGLVDSNNFETLTEFEIHWMYAPPDQLRWLLASPLWQKPSRITLAMPISLVAQWTAEAELFTRTPNRQITIKGAFFDLRFVARDGLYDLYAENPRPGVNHPLQACAAELRRLCEPLEQRPNELTITVDHAWPLDLIAELRSMGTRLNFVGEAQP